MADADLFTGGERHKVDWKSECDNRVLPMDRMQYVEVDSNSSVLRLDGLLEELVAIVRPMLYGSRPCDHQWSHFTKS